MMLASWAGMACCELFYTAASVSHTVEALAYGSMVAASIRLYDFALQLTVSDRM